MFELSFYPNNLKEAVETLITFFENEIELVKSMQEEDFIADSHHNGGKFIRNTWNLWWYEGHRFEDWPKEKPNLVSFFNDLGIVHADDISGIILTCFYRELKNYPYNLEQQVEMYKDHWKTEGYKDGIFKRGGMN